MAVTAGTQVGPYQLVEPIGAGGMGEVYRANDTRLGRDVAVKVLPKGFASDTDRLRRFEQEAQTLASVNHPNLLVLYDTGIFDGQPYLVSELLEGRTLRAELDEGQLPIRKAVNYALQIAHGLAAAHSQGVIHLDLKPENIVVTRDGRLKILDFGLAKLSAPRKHDPAENGAPGTGGEHQPKTPAESSSSNGPGSESGTPDLQNRAATGVVMGTVAYMSPEQIKGENADHRSDIFAFGAIFYEMLSGNSPFRRQDTIETMRAVVREDPYELSQATLPPGLDLIVRRCLDKNPELRFQNGRDLAFAIEALSPGWQAQTPQYARAGRSRAWLYLWPMVGAVLAMGLLAFAVLRRPSADQPQLVQLAIAPPSGILPEQFAISPDGAAIVFLGYNTSGKRQLWLRRIDEPLAHSLNSTDDATFAFWAPDGQSIGFLGRGLLRVIDLRSRTVREVCRTAADDNLTGSWGSRGGILLGGSGKAGLDWIADPVAGATPQKATTLNEMRHETGHRFPQFLPDGRHFIYYAESELPENTGLYIAELGKISESKRILDQNDTGGRPFVFAPPGYLIVWNEQAILARPFNAQTMEVSGAPVALVKPASEGVIFSASQNGVLVYGERPQCELQLTWVDRTGTALKAYPVRSPAAHFDFSLSPDDRSVAFFSHNAQTGGQDLIVMALDNGVPNRLMSHGSRNSGPVWSPDGTELVFRSARTGTSDLYRIPTYQPGAERPLLISDDYKYPEQWTAQGLLFSVFSPKGGADIWRLQFPAQSAPTAEPLLAKPGVFEINGQLSPDGKWIAYAADETTPGLEQVHVRRFPELTEKQTLPGGGRDPRWSRIGNELFYVDNSGNLTGVPVRVEGLTLRFGAPQPLFPIRMSGFVSQRNFFAVTSDGQHFLVTNVVGDPASAHVNLVMNWTLLLDGTKP